MSPELSHFDGRSPSVTECPICLLPVNQEYKVEDFCLPCSRYLRLVNYVQSLVRFRNPSLIMLIMIWLIPVFAVYKPLMPILIIFVLAPVILTSSFMLMRIYKDMPPEHTINHQLKFYSRHGSAFYSGALENTKNVQGNLDPRHQTIILDHLVKSIIFSKTINSTEMYEEWAEAFNISVDDLLDKLFHHTDLIDAFSYNKAIGVLPNLWPLLSEKEDLRVLVLDKLLTEVSQLDEATDTENQFFLEDLYLIEDEIRSEGLNDKKWDPIIQALDEFEPELPPKNPLQSLKAQMDENARLIEQKNNQR